MSEISRSAEATTPLAARRVARRRRTLPSGWWGVALLAATEAAIFGVLLASYFYLRFRASDWPPPGDEGPKAGLPFVLTAVLVATTVPLLLASAAARQGRRGIAWWLIALALAVQAGYLAVQIVLFRDDLTKFSPRDSAYGSIYFTMLAVHHAHVLFGILFDGAMLALLLRGLTNYRVVGVQALALYWCFVNAAAVFVVLTQLSPSL